MPRKILLFGAGKSASELIRYFLLNAKIENWELSIADLHPAHAHFLCRDASEVKIYQTGVEDREECRLLISEHDIVISLLPASMHHIIALWCIEFKRNLVTASYVDEQMASLDAQAKEAGITLMNEAGLDPGIDHMSAMKLIDGLKSQNAEIIAFRSYTGGLIADENDNNPWNYKFTWNPRNVVLAGQSGMAKYLEAGEFKYVPYHRLFTATRDFNLGRDGQYEGYPNRDSLKYRESYGLRDIETMIRGTLRKKGFSKAWNALVQVGLTADNAEIEVSGMSWRQLLNAFLPYSERESVEEKLLNTSNLQVDKEILEKLKWLGLLDAKLIPYTGKASPAMLLQILLEEKWKLEEGDKDLIVMIHQLEYRLHGENKTLESSLIVKGEDSIFTGMSKTVGLPAALTAKFILDGRYQEKGVQIPIQPSIYEPVLKTLGEYGIIFTETLT